MHLIVTVLVHSLAIEHYPCKALVPCDKYVYKADRRTGNRLCTLLYPQLCFVLCQQCIHIFHLPDVFLRHCVIINPTKMRTFNAALPDRATECETCPLPVIRQNNVGPSFTTSQFPCYKGAWRSQGLTFSCMLALQGV